MKAFLMIGQSNMAGRGDFGEVAEIQNPLCKMLRNGKWIPMREPINPDRGIFDYFHSGVGLAASFADAYAKYFNEEIGLIPCADGGTGLDQWREGSLLYDHAVMQGRLASRTSTIAGVLWHQGEADCSEELSSTYQQRLEVMLGALRETLDLQEVPIILGGLGDFLQFYPLKDNDYIRINQALKSLASSNELIGFASAEGLPANCDNLHFNADSLYKLGLRYFDEFEKLHNNCKSLGKKMITEDIHRGEMELL